MDLTPTHLERLAAELDDIATGARDTSDSLTGGERAHHDGRASAYTSAAAMVRGLADRYPDLAPDREALADRAIELVENYHNGNLTDTCDEVAAAGAGLTALFLSELNGVHGPQSMNRAVLRIAERALA